MRPRRRTVGTRISCTLCEKTFSKLEHLNRHELAHTGERPFKCSICSKQFARRDVLLRHRRNHASDRDFTDKGSVQALPSSNLFPVDPFAGSPIMIQDQVDANYSHNINLVLPAIIDGSGSNQIAVQPLVQEPQAAAREMEVYENTALFPRDPNANYLNILFSPPVLPQLSSSDLMYNTNSLSHIGGEIFDVHTNTLVESVSRSNSRNTDCEPEKIKTFWPARQESPARPRLWHDVAFGSMDNIFSTADFDMMVEPAGQTPESDNGTEIDLNSDIKRRLRDLKRNISAARCNCTWDTDSTCSQRYLCLNAMELFDQGLYLYIHRYQPVHPLLHLPTFDPQNTSTSLLFVMCMIGLSLLKTDEAMDFIKKTYPGILNEVYIQALQSVDGSRSINEVLSPLTLAHHMLFLFISTGGTLCPEKSRLLYIHTLTAAQRYGFFCSRLDKSYESLYSPLLDEEGRWKAWSRVEATKNLIIGLLLHDSWLSGLFSSSPIISANSIYLALPTEDLLYRAHSAEKWMQLVTQGSSTLTPILELSSYGFHLPDLPRPVHAFSMYGLLCSVLLRVSADCHRLVSSSDLVSPEQHISIPWNICRLDKRGSIASPLLMQAIQSYDQTFRESNPNCIVIWHSVCILLAVDINVLESGAGRDGPEAMHEGRRALARWAQTPSARRSCLHAAQIFRTLSHRKPADGTAFQSVRALFMSALVLGLYILMGPTYERTGESGVFDLADAEVNWKEVGDEGISSSGSPDPSQTPNQNDVENLAVYFIRHGGPILFSSKIYHPGARHAQRMILDFAGLLDEVGTHWMADYARLLYMVNDTMGNSGT